jgi:hypothetical protein
MRDVPISYDAEFFTVNIRDSPTNDGYGGVQARPSTPRKCRSRLAPRRFHLGTPARRTSPIELLYGRLPPLAGRSIDLGSPLRRSASRPGKGNPEPLRWHAR